MTAIPFYLAGLISLLEFNDVAIRYINPQVSGVQMIGFFAIFRLMFLHFGRASGCCTCSRSFCC